jgi:hypothetical protein
MADTKFSAMPTASTLTGGEIVPLVQSAANKQQTVSNILDQGLQATVVTEVTTAQLTTINMQTAGLTGYLYGNGGSGNVTASTTIPASAITTQYGVFQNNATLTNVTPGTGIAMQFDTADIHGHGIEVINDGAGHPTKVTLAEAGLYNFQFSAQLNKAAGGGSAADVYIWARLDGTDVPETNTRVTLQGANVYTVAAWNLMFNVTAGQYFQLMWGSTDANAVIQYITTPTIGPVVPAVILTVNRVA